MAVVIGFFIVGILGWIILSLSVKYDNEGLGALGIIMGICGLIISLFTSLDYDITSEWIVKDVTHVRTPRLVIVDDGTKTWEFESYIDVTSINDSTQFEFEHTTNFWGSEDIEGIRIKND